MNARSSYMYDSDRREWVGAVFVGRKLVTIGCMASEADIKAWLAEVMATRAWETHTEPPDLYDTRH